MTSHLNNESTFRMGGEFGITPGHFLQSPQKQGILRSGKKHHLYLDTGRSAIYVALLNIIERGGKREAWLPRYCCPSVILPFEQLGFKVHFYSLGRSLAAPAFLPEKITGATFLFIHYFGKVNRAIIDYLREMKKLQEFFVIEDCVQALLNPEVGGRDYAVYSCRKFLPQPDGALLASDFPLGDHQVEPADEAFISRKLIAKLIRRADDERCLDLSAQAEKIVDSSIRPRMMSFVSRCLLARTDAAEIAGKRRANFFYLRDLLRGAGTEGYGSASLSGSGTEPYPCAFLFDSLDEHEVPLGLPVLLPPGRRDDLRDFLKNSRIYCPVHWPLKEAGHRGWEDEMNLSLSILTLPIDQRYDFTDLDFLFNELAEFFKMGRRGRPLRSSNLPEQTR